MGESFKEADPKKETTEYFSNLYGLEPDKEDEERQVKAHYVDFWHSLRIDVPMSYRITPDRLRIAIKRLKEGRTSPTGSRQR